MEQAEKEGFKKHTLFNAKKVAKVKSWIEYDDEGNKLWFCGLPGKEHAKMKLLPALE